MRESLNNLQYVIRAIALSLVSSLINARLAIYEASYLIKNVENKVILWCFTLDSAVIDFTASVIIRRSNLIQFSQIVRLPFLCGPLRCQEISII